MLAEVPHREPLRVDPSQFDEQATQRFDGTFRAPGGVEKANEALALQRCEDVAKRPPTSRHGSDGVTGCHPVAGPPLVYIENGPEPDPTAPS
jgi:hypothetical protein